MAVAPLISPEGGRELVLSVWSFVSAAAAQLPCAHFDIRRCGLLPPLCLHPTTPLCFYSQIPLLTHLLCPQANQQSGTQGLPHSQGPICFSRLRQPWQVQTNAWRPSCPAARLYGHFMWDLGEAQDIWVRTEVLVHPDASFKPHVPW